MSSVQSIIPPPTKASAAQASADLEPIAPAIDTSAVQGGAPLATTTDTTSLKSIIQGVSPVGVSDIANSNQSGHYRVYAADMTEAEFPETLHQYIENAPSTIVAIYCRGAAEIVKALEGFARRRGTTIYAWTVDRGLISLREQGIVVPASRRLAEALRYVQQSAHFGIYLIPVAGAQLTPPIVAQLRQISRVSDGALKRIVLLNESGDLPTSILEYCAHLQMQPRSSAKLRMRDGRWVR